MLRAAIETREGGAWVKGDEGRIHKGRREQEGKKEEKKGYLLSSRHSENYTKPFRKVIQNI